LSPTLSAEQHTLTTANGGGENAKASTSTSTTATAQLATTLTASTSPTAGGGMAPTFTGGCMSHSGTGDLTSSELGSYTTLHPQDPSRVQAATSPRRLGTCSARVEVQSGDVDTNQTDRTEYTGPHTLWHNGDDVWYAYSFLLPSDSPLPAIGEWMCVHQFFAQDIPNNVSGGSPPLAVEITTGGSVLIHVRGGVKASAGQTAPRNDSYRLADASRGVWHDLLFHVHWSTGSDGLVQVWHSSPGVPFPSTPQVTATGVNLPTVAGDILPVYAETGIYRSRVAFPQVVYQGGLWARTNRPDAEAFFDNAPG
jgi:Polysaccharide lyase